MKSGKVTIELITIYCPNCNTAYENPDSGTSDIQPGEYEQMNRRLECQNCGESFYKPTVTFEREHGYK